MSLRPMCVSTSAGSTSTYAVPSSAMEVTTPTSTAPPMSCRSVVFAPPSKFANHAMVVPAAHGLEVDAVCPARSTSNAKPPNPAWFGLRFEAKRLTLKPATYDVPVYVPYVAGSTRTLLPLVVS